MPRELAATCGLDHHPDGDHDCTTWEALLNAPVVWTGKRWVTCTNCGGSGWIDGMTSPIACSTCDGKGYTEEDYE